jgi:hypothetical protein
MTETSPITPEDLAEEASLPPLAPPPAPRPPQGIAVRFMNTGDSKKDLHPKHRSVRRIDPESLLVRRIDPETGEELEVLPPAMALPIADSRDRCIKRVNAAAAAELLECDWSSGGATVHRLATDAEVAELERQQQGRSVRVRPARQGKSK